MESEFLDLKSKARELGLNYLALRARILSNDLQCFVYLAGVDLRSVGTHEWLPAWEREKFPFIHWKDHGALWTSELEPRRDARTQQNRYTVRGFAMLDPYAVDAVLTAGKIEIDRNWVHICDSQYDIVCDGRDNDCDGRIDEEVSCSCGGAVAPCSAGTQQCIEQTVPQMMGVFGACSGVGPSPEICDNIDNDCDGRIDELVTRSCGSAIAPCTVDKYVRAVVLVARVENEIVKISNLLATCNDCRNA